MSVKLYDHQLKGLEETEGLNKVAYYWDMGTGKTFVGAEKLVRLGAKVNLVICQKSKIEDWIEHFKSHYVNIQVLDLTKNDQLTAFTFADMGYPAMIVGVINYDLIWRRPEIQKIKDFTLLLDESSLVQNEGRKKTKAILKLKAKNVILLSGTPTGGKYEKLWSQLHLLGWDISKKLYWSQFVITDSLDLASGQTIKVVTGYQRVDRLKAKMYEYGCRFLKTDEVYDMPAQTFTKIKVEASKEYKDFKKKSIISFKWDDEKIELVGDTSLTKMLYERQLCSVYSREKLKAFTDLLESTEDRLIVFYNFTAELEAMIKVLPPNRMYSVVNGKEKDLLNYEHFDDTVTFIQYQAGAMGLNLQKANKIVYFSLPLSSELYEQSKKRIHRIGQNRPCFYYILLVKGSIENKILNVLNERKDYTAKLFEKDD